MGLLLQDAYIGPYAHLLRLVYHVGNLAHVHRCGLATQRLIGRCAGLIILPTRELGLHNTDLSPRQKSQDGSLNYRGTCHSVSILTRVSPSSGTRMQRKLSCKLALPNCRFILDRRAENRLRHS